MTEPRTRRARPGGVKSAEEIKAELSGNRPSRVASADIKAIEAKLRKEMEDKLRAEIEVNVRAEVEAEHVELEAAQSYKPPHLPEDPPGTYYNVFRSFRGFGVGCSQSGW